MGAFILLLEIGSSGHTFCSLLLTRITLNKLGSGGIHSVVFLVPGSKRVAVGISRIKVFPVEKLFLLNGSSATRIKHDEKVVVLDRSFGTLLKHDQKVLVLDHSFGTGIKHDSF